MWCYLPRVRSRIKSRARSWWTTHSYFSVFVISSCINPTPLHHWHCLYPGACGGCWPRAPCTAESGLGGHDLKDDPVKCSAAAVWLSVISDTSKPTMNQSQYQPVSPPVRSGSGHHLRRPASLGWGSSSYRVLESPSFRMHRQEAELSTKASFSPEHKVPGLRNIKLLNKSVKV